VKIRKYKDLKTTDKNIYFKKYYKLNKLDKPCYSKENFKKFYLIHRRVYEKLQYSKEPSFKCDCGGKYQSPSGMRHMQTKRHKTAESCIEESWSKLVLHFIN
jgi:hypothetical protein